MVSPVHGAYRGEGQAPEGAKEIEDGTATTGVNVWATEKRKRRSVQFIAKDSHIRLSTMNTASTNPTSVNRGLPNLPPLTQAVERQLKRRRTWIRRLPIKLTAIAALAWTSLFASKPAQAQDASCYFNWASQYDDQGDYDRAIANYTMAISLCPSDQVAYNNRGYDWWKKGQFDKAIADYNQALALCPNYGAVYSNRGVAWDDKGEHDRAAADFAQAIAVDPNVAAAYNNRGTVEAGHQQFAQAKADYYRALTSRRLCRMRRLRAGCHLAAKNDRPSAGRRQADDDRTLGAVQRAQTLSLAANVRQSGERLETKVAGSLRVPWWGAAHGTNDARGGRHTECDCYLDELL